MLRARSSASKGGLFILSAVVGGVLSSPARAAGPADFLVHDLSLVVFKRNIFDLSTIPAFPGFPTASRYWAYPGNATAVNYLKGKLESFGYTNVTLDPYVFSGQTRFNVYATKIGTVQPTQMYIVSAHMDSINLSNFTNAPGADDDGSGTALVLEAARVFAKARTDVSIRFILWNNEETGLNGSSAYVAAHAALQGTPGEPTWLGIIQHDMILYDHFPAPDADVEYQGAHNFGGQAVSLATFVAGAMATYGSIPAQVSDNMDFTDSKSFWNHTAAVSVRENRRVAEIGAGSNPHWHRATDRFNTYTQADYLFGFNIVKMSVGAIGELVNAERDCNMNDIGDASEIAGGAPDVNGDGILDACQDCNNNGTLDPVEVSGGSVPDCNANGIPDECDIAGGISQDCSANGIPDECEPDCNSNAIPDECDIADCTGDPACGDCNANLVPDGCDITSGTTPDCNANGIPDACDLAACTGDPQCADCNSNAIPDECDVADCTGDPACGDCNGNLVPDGCDITSGTTPDCNANGIADACDLAACTGDAACADCNANSIPDGCETDCNSNAIPDECDIRAGVSRDADANGIPDECEAGACCDGTTGLCADDVPMALCTGNQRGWSVTALCAGLDPPCAGACCDLLTGGCTENVPPSACSGAHQRWTGRATCNDVACDAVTGACCDHDPFGACTDGVTLAACGCPTCEWAKLSSCSELDCLQTTIPTVSSWALAILSLLLMTGAKVRFGLGWR